MNTLDTFQLEAFAAVARTRNFSAAARELGLTQPALSQRVLNLERALGVTLFTRGPRQATLTAQGERLLRYWRSKESLEAELSQDLAASEPGALTGWLRVAGYSTIMRSRILPALTSLARAHPGLRLQLSIAEMRELPARLLSGDADFVLLDRRFERAGTESMALPVERYVLVRPRKPVFDRADVILDHDADDPVTEMFFRSQKNRAQSVRSKPASRMYLDEIYTILDGVASGLGRAIVPLHLLAADSRLERVPGYRDLDIPVFLHYLTQPYQARVHEAALAALIKAK